MGYTITTTDNELFQVKSSNTNEWIVETPSSENDIKTQFIIDEYFDFLQNIIKIQYDFPYRYVINDKYGAINYPNGTKNGNQVILDLCNSTNYVLEIHKEVSKILCDKGLTIDVHLTNDEITPNCKELITNINKTLEINNADINLTILLKWYNQLNYKYGHIEFTKDNQVLFMDYSGEETVEYKFDLDNMLSYQNIELIDYLYDLSNNNL